MDPPPPSRDLENHCLCEGDGANKSNGNGSSWGLYCRLFGLLEMRRRGTTQGEEGSVCMRQAEEADPKL